MERSRNQYLSENTNSFNVSGAFNQINTHIVVHPTTTTGERLRILSWLSPLEPRERHHNVATNRFPGVGEWVLKATEFQAWRSKRDEDSVDAVLFCYGVPGAGKTFICSLAIDRLCDETAGGNVGVACLYCHYRDREDQIPTNMIGSLLKQFVAGLPEVPGDINEAFQTSKGQLGGRAPQLQKIIDLFPGALAQYEQAFVFVDAIDEIRVEHRTEFIRCLRRIIQGSPNVRIFITGRAHVRPELSRNFTESLSVISIHPKDEDFKVYLTARLDTDPDPDAMDDDLRYEILTYLPRQLSGIFLPIALRADAILGETTIYDRRKALYRATDGLDGIYRTTLERIRWQRGSKSRLGIAILMSLSLAGRALRIDEIYHSLAVNQEGHNLNIKKVPSIQTLLGSCLGLVTFDRETSTVRLVHTTSVAPQDHAQRPLFSIPKHETGSLAHGPASRRPATEREL